MPHHEDKGAEAILPPRIAMAGLKNALHLFFREGECWIVVDLGRFHGPSRVLRDPVVLLAEPKERAQPFQVLRGIARTVVPARAKLAHLVYPELLQVAVTPEPAPRDEATLQETCVLADRLLVEVLG